MGWLLQTADVFNTGRSTLAAATVPTCLSAFPSVSFVQQDSSRPYCMMSMYHLHMAYCTWCLWAGGHVLVLRWDCLAREKGGKRCWDVNHGEVELSWKGGPCWSICWRRGLGLTTYWCLAGTQISGEIGAGLGHQHCVCKGLKQPVEPQLRKRPALQGVQQKCLCAEGD